MMSTTPLTTDLSPPLLGPAVRRLAREAQAWRISLRRDERERERLLDQIDDLGRTLEGTDHQPLKRWLENLRRNLNLEDAPVGSCG